MKESLEKFSNFLKVLFCFAFYDIIIYRRGYCVEWIQQPNSVTYLIADEEKIVRTINIRYVLDDYLKRCGGHIGYNIRPSERRKGF